MRFDRRTAQVAAARIRNEAKSESLSVVEIVSDDGNVLVYNRGYARHKETFMIDCEKGTMEVLV